MRAGEPRDRCGRARWSTWRSTTSRAWWTPRSGATSWSSGRRRRWWPGSSTSLAARGIPAFGPSAAAARLEGSKAFAKEVMEAAGVPTAAWSAVSTVDEGMAAISGYPVVLKFDGLAAGKGVVIAADESVARATLEEFLVARRFGEGQVVVEECLVGEELSLLALCDGERAVADGAGAGLQAHLRRRRGAEHRRHGVLLAGAGHLAGASGGDLRARAPAGRRPAGRARDAVSRGALRRDHAHRRRAEGARVQRPLRRSRRRRPCCRACARTCCRSCAPRSSRAASPASGCSGRATGR